MKPLNIFWETLRYSRGTRRVPSSASKTRHASRGSTRSLPRRVRRAHNRSWWGPTYLISSTFLSSENPNASLAYPPSLRRRRRTRRRCLPSTLLLRRSSRRRRSRQLSRVPLVRAALPCRSRRRTPLRPMRRRPPLRPVRRPHPTVHSSVPTSTRQARPRRHGSLRRSSTTNSRTSKRVSFPRPRRCRPSSTEPACSCPFHGPWTTIL